MGTLVIPTYSMTTPTEIDLRSPHWSEPCSHQLPYRCATPRSVTWNEVELEETLEPEQETQREDTLDWPSMEDVVKLPLVTC